MQCLQWWKFQTRRLWPHSRRRRPCTKSGSLGHLAGHQDWYPAATIRFITLPGVKCLRKHWIICITRQGAVMKWFVLSIQSSWQSLRCRDIFCLALVSPGCSCCLFHSRTLSTNRCVTPKNITTAHWTLPFDDNKTICHRTCSRKFRGMMPPITQEKKKKEDLLKMHVVISRWLDLSLSLKMTATGMFIFERVLTLYNQTRGFGFAKNK